MHPTGRFTSYGSNIIDCFDKMGPDGLKNPNSIGSISAGNTRWDPNEKSWLTNFWYLMEPTFTTQEGGHAYFKVPDANGDPRGSTANLWNARNIKFDYDDLVTNHGFPPLEEVGVKPPRMITGDKAIGVDEVMTKYATDDFNGSKNGLGFIYALLVYQGDVVKYSMSGKQDNTETLMNAMTFMQPLKGGVEGLRIGVDNSVPHAILAVLSTHTIGSIPNFPRITDYLKCDKMSADLKNNECMSSLEYVIKLPFFDIDL